MNAGRPRKPHAIRALEGGRGHSRPLTEDLPAPKGGLDVIPAGLSKAERVAWAVHVEWLRALGLESGVDAGTLTAMVRAYCRARQADRRIARYGLTYETGAGMLWTRPAVAISSESWSKYVQLAVQFGMTPAARAKLGSAPDQKPERAADLPQELRALASASGD